MNIMGKRISLKKNQKNNVKALNVYILSNTTENLLRFRTIVCYCPYMCVCVGREGVNASIRKFIEYRRYFLARWELETKS